jgi:hypothetical protein
MSSEHSSGEDPEGESGLIRRFTDQYEKKQTRRAYRTDLEKLKDFLEERSTTLLEAGQEELLQFLWKEDQSVGQSTVRRRATALNSFFGWLEEEGLRAGPLIEEDQSASSLVETAVDEGPFLEKSFQGKRTPEENPPQERGPNANGEGTQDRAGREATDDQPSGAAEEPRAGEDTNREDTGQGATGERSTRSSRKSGQIEENGQGEDASQEEQAHTSSPGPLDIPPWIYDAAEEKAEDLFLISGRDIPLAEVPGALRYGLGELVEGTDSDFGPNFLGLYLDRDDLSVTIRLQEGPSAAGQMRIEAEVKHRVIERVAERGPDSLRSYHTVPTDALWYFRGRGWRMPPEAYDLVEFSHTGGRSERRPIFRCSDTSARSRYSMAVEVAGALAKALGIEKDEEVLVSLSP